MNDTIAQEIADNLGRIARALGEQNDHLESIANRIEAVEDQVNYVGQGVVTLAPSDEG